jgi:hypothetical protein
MRSNRTLNRARPFRALARVGRVCAIDTALTPDEILNVFAATMGTNQVGRGWIPVAPGEYPGRIKDAIDLAAADPTPVGRAPRLICAVVSGHSNSRREVYIGVVPGTSPGLFGAIFAARQLTRAGQAVLRHDPGARLAWGQADGSPLAELAKPATVASD